MTGRISIEWKPPSPTSGTFDAQSFASVGPSHSTT
jgi:hypothetical protein